MVDLNEDITSTHTTQMFQLLGLHELIINKHKNKTLQPTWNRGFIPIDGIFISKSLKPTASGYTSLSYFPSDHMALWTDLNITNVFGSKIPQTIHPNANWLKLRDPNVVKTFNRYYSKFIISKKLLEIINNVYWRWSIPVSFNDQDE